MAAAAAAALAAPRASLRWAGSGRAVDLALLGALLLLAASLVPLPPAAVNLLSPEAWRVRALTSLGAPGLTDWRPVSVDPGATWHALGTLAAAALAYGAARAAFASGGVRRFCRLLAVTAVLLAAASLVQRVAAPDLVLGVIAPQDAGARPFGPFVNRHHLAGWLLMATPVVAGYFVAHLRIHTADVREWRAGLRTLGASGGLLLGVALLILIGTFMATLSRSGLAGAAAAVLAGLLGARRRAHWTGGGARIAAAAALAGAAALAVYGNVGEWVERLETGLQARPIDRRVIWRETTPMIRDFWLTGVGAGAYGPAMLVYQRSRVEAPHLGGVFHFNQAHSHYLQAAAEGGLVLGVLVVVGLAGLARGGRQALARDVGEIYWARLGAAAGLVGIAVQSIWETSLRMPPNALLAATLVALVLHVRQQAPADEASSRS